MSIVSHTPASPFPSPLRGGVRGGASFIGGQALSQTPTPLPNGGRERTEHVERSVSKPKALIAWSSGKDSAWALHEVRRAGDYDVVGALTTITENLRRTGLAETAEVRGEDVSRYLASAAARDDRFELVVLDPPYEARAILPPLEGVVALLAPSATVVVKHFWRTSVPVPDGLRMWRDRRFGETTLTFLEAP